MNWSMPRSGPVLRSSLLGKQPWGYTAVFADPDGHLWMVEAQSFMAAGGATSGR